MGDNTDLDIELEALRFSYPEEDLAISSSDDGLSVSYHVCPRTGEDVHDHLVEATLLLRLGAGYPATPPTIQVTSKGLGDKREAAMASLLRNEVSQMAGEMVLSHLCEASASFITANNFPEGDCTFCLCSMTSHESGSPALLEPVVRLPACFHVMHRQCYVQWWAWQQLSLAGKEREIISHTGSATAAALTAKVPPREPSAPQHYAVVCPACRLATPLTALHHIRDELEAALQQQQQQRRAGTLPRDTSVSSGGGGGSSGGGRKVGRGKGSSAGGDNGSGDGGGGGCGSAANPGTASEAPAAAWQDLLTADERDKLREAQAARSAAFARQLALGGVICPQNFSIAGWSGGGAGGGADASPAAASSARPASADGTRSAADSSPNSKTAISTATAAQHAACEAGKQAAAAQTGRSAKGSGARREGPAPVVGNGTSAPAEGGGTTSSSGAKQHHAPNGETRQTPRARHHAPSDETRRQAAAAAQTSSRGVQDKGHCERPAAPATSAAVVCKVDYGTRALPPTSSTSRSCADAGKQSQAGAKKRTGGTGHNVSAAAGAHDSPCQHSMLTGTAHGSTTVCADGTGGTTGPPRQQQEVPEAVHGGGTECVVSTGGKDELRQQQQPRLTIVANGSSEVQAPASGRRKQQSRSPIKPA